MTSGFADTPAPPYFAVIFTSQRTGADAGYAATAEAMFELVKEQPGFLGAESARGPDGFGITVAYFENEAAIEAWKRNAEHLAAQRLGKADWYAHYQVRVARIERSASGPEAR
jgi:heme-degrading monooxygenase HmoA